MTVRLMCSAFLLSGLLICHAGAQRVEYNFTTEEGFTNGNVNSHTDWWGTTEANMVDTGGSGSVVLDPDTIWVNSTCAQGVSPVKSQSTVSTHITFNETHASGRGDIFSLIAKRSQYRQIPDIRVALRRVDDSYLLFFKSIEGGPVYSTQCHPSALGLNGTLNDGSDELVLTMTLLRREDSSDWTIKVTLYNEAKSEMLFSYDATDVASTPEFFNSTQLFFGFSSSIPEEQTGVGNRRIHHFSIECTERETGTAAQDASLTDIAGATEHGNPRQEEAAPAADADMTSTTEDLAAEHDASFELSREVKQLLTESRSVDNVPFFEIPSRQQKLQQYMDALQRELKALPHLNDALQLDAYGYHGGYLPCLGELPDHPRWTLDFTFNQYVSLSKIILVPAVDPRFGKQTSYGFPRRFRVLAVDSAGNTRLIREWMKADCPDPGRYPLIIDIPDPEEYIVRVEVYRGALERNRELFALDELFGIMGAAVQPCISVKAGSEFDSPPYWGKNFVIDRKTSLGLPLDVRNEIRAGAPRNDFMVTFDAPPKQECVIELDLGENRKYGWVALYPAQSAEGIMIPGFGFPGTIAMEIETETPSGSRGKTRRVPWDWRGLEPGNNVFRMSGADLTGRWIRLIMRDLPLHNGRFTFAMGEIQVYRKDTTYPVESIRLEGFPPDAQNRVHKMMDGRSGGYPVMPLLEWMYRIEKQNDLSQLLEEVERRKQGLDQRWKKTWQITGWSVASLLILTASAIAAIAVIERRRQLTALKRRITRDLHDEVGSSLGSISITAIQLENEVQDKNLREEMNDLSLMALEASASLREVVWMFDVDSVLLPDLLQKMAERVERVLQGKKIFINIAPDFPASHVSLTFKRHLIMFFKEAVHNCARHSRAEQVWIDFARRGGILRISIRDDGCGFEPSAVSAGWGLESMEERAREIGAALNIESEPGKGTTVSLEVPLRKISKEPQGKYSTSN